MSWILSIIPTKKLRKFNKYILGYDLIQINKQNQKLMNGNHLIEFWFLNIVEIKNLEDFNFVLKRNKRKIHIMLLIYHWKTFFIQFISAKTWTLNNILLRIVFIFISFVTFIVLVIFIFLFLVLRKEKICHQYFELIIIDKKITSVPLPSSSYSSPSILVFSVKTDVATFRSLK